MSTAARHSSDNRQSVRVRPKGSAETGQPVVYFETNSAGTQQAAELYGALFGWTIDANNPMN